MLRTAWCIRNPQLKMVQDYLYALGNIYRIRYHAIKMCRRFQKMLPINCLPLHFIKDHKCSMNDTNGVQSVKLIATYTNRTKSSCNTPNVLIKSRLEAWLSITFLALPHEKVELFKADVAKAVLQMLSTARISSSV